MGSHSYNFKNMNIAKRKILLGLILLSAALGFSLFSYKAQESKEKSISKRPDAAHAFQELYGAPNPTTKISPDKNHLATLWFEKEFNDGIEDLYVLFSKNQELDEQGSPASCHVCMASIDVITYIRKQDKWIKEGTTRNVAQLGSYGDVEPVKDVKLLQLSLGNVILAIPSTDGGQGITHKGENLLNHFESRWSEVGYLNLSGDNADSDCTNNINSTKAETDNPCYSYQSTYRLQEGKNKKFPNIIVSRRGRDFSIQSGKVEEVGDEIYIYNGKKYLSTQQKLELDRQDALQKNSIQATQQTSSENEVKLTKEQAEKAMDSITNKLSQCVLPAAQYGQYSSHDGGKSVLKILGEKCPSEYHEWINVCIATGLTKEHCNLNVAILTQVGIKSFGK